jgi:putative SbcD/Mre11-related phosphoesterase
MSTLRFVTGKPALLVGKSLVIADLHLGVERDFRRSGIKLPSQAGKVTKAVDEIIEETKPEKLIILGDVKHKVPGTSFQELREIPEFFEHFSRKIEVHMLLGNHDGGIEKIVPKNVKVHGTEGFADGDIYFSHGHTWPAPSFLKCKYIIAGHRHPVIEFRDKLGYRFVEQAWMRGKLDVGKVNKKYKTAPGSMPEVIIMPAFNPLIMGGHALNRKHGQDYRREMGPLINSISPEKAGLYLLDGTYIGTLSEIKGAKVN